LWRCENGHMNLPFAQFCTTCGKPRPPLETSTKAKEQDWLQFKSHYVGKTVKVKLPGPSPTSLPPHVGKLTIHGYECRSILGKTGLSATLLCVDSHGVSRVLKIPAQWFDSIILGRKMEKLSRFESMGRERQILMELMKEEHPCIVKLEEIFEARQDEPPALVLEFCTGGSLADVLIKTGPLDPLTAASIIVQIADALAFLHKKGYAHGDVKPENILFSGDKVPKLADFNSARAIATASRSRVPLTPGYAAPEDVKTGRPSQKGDVWSLALVLLEAVTGKPLFASPDFLPYEEELQAFREGKVKLPGTGDKELDEILEQCLKVDPNERPDMDDFERMLIKYLTKRLLVAG